MTSGHRLHVRFRLSPPGRTGHGLGDRPVDGYGRASWEFSAPDRDYTGYVIRSRLGQRRRVRLRWTCPPLYRYLRWFRTPTRGHEQGGPAEEPSTTSPRSTTSMPCSSTTGCTATRHQVPTTETASLTGPRGAGRQCRETRHGPHSCRPVAFRQAYPYSKARGAQRIRILRGEPPTEANLPLERAPWSFEMLANRPDSTLWIMSQPGVALAHRLPVRHQSEDIGFGQGPLDQLGDWGHSEDHQGGMATTGRSVDLCQSSSARSSIRRLTPPGNPSE